MGDPGASRKPVALAVGGNELPELIRQSRDYAEARAKTGAPVTLDVIAGRDPITIVDEVAAPDGVIANRLAGLLAV